MNLHVHPGRPLLAKLVGLAFATSIAMLLGVLLWRELFEGRAQSFDSLLYARTLWGVAHGDVFNPLLGVSGLAVHAHLLSVPLAPFTRVLPAAGVLVIAQAISFGACVYLVWRGFQDAARDGGTGSGLLEGAWGSALAVLATPLVLNPFFFDARPDLLGLPFLVGGLLGAVRRGTLDRRSLVLLGVGVLAREEFALVFAAALILLPRRAEGREGIRTGVRWALAALAVCLFLLYFFGIRRWLGGNQLAVSAHLLGGTRDAAASAQQLLVSKLTLLAALATSAGGLVWPGWRWLGCALPGLVLLLCSRWMPEMQLRSHYGLLVAPGLLAAAVAGYRRLAISRHRRWWLLAASGLGTACFVLGGAAPGGRLFAKENFEMIGPGGGLSWQLGEVRPGVRAAHARLAAIPRHHGLVAPWALAAPLADRHLIWTEEKLAESLPAGELPADLTTAALLRANLVSVGRPLVALHGFRLAGYSGGPLEVITRDAATQHIPWPLLAREPGRACLRPVTRWPHLGLVLCQLTAPQSQRARALFWRDRRVEPSPTLIPLLRTAGSSAPMPLWLLEGMVNLRDLPVGLAAVAVSDGAVQGTTLEVVLVDGHGRPLR